MEPTDAGFFLERERQGGGAGGAFVVSQLSFSRAELAGRFVFGSSSCVQKELGLVVAEEVVNFWGHRGRGRVAGMGVARFSDKMADARRQNRREPVFASLVFYSRFQSPRSGN